MKLTCKMINCPYMNYCRKNEGIKDFNNHKVCSVASSVIVKEDKEVAGFDVSNSKGV